MKRTPQQKRGEPRVLIVGMGYVGLIQAACFASLGYEVSCVDSDVARIAKLRQGVAPIHEPGLEPLLAEGMRSGRLTFWSDYAEAMAGRAPAFVFLCVGTPPKRDGSADMSHVRQAARSVATHLANSTILVTKSTVPVGTGREVERLMRHHTSHAVAVVSNPEFLREGSSIQDFMHPDKVVIGSADAKAAARVAGLYAAFSCPIIVTGLETAELIKYAQNSLLATEISFINAIADLAERVGADAQAISQALKYDRRIGPHAFLSPGPGYGGFCFPKDVQALIHSGRKAKVRSIALFEEVDRINQSRVDQLLKKAGTLLPARRRARVAVLGLTFKGGTDDVRLSPAVALAGRLAARGLQVTAYDPMGMEGAKKILGERIAYAASAYAAVSGADLVIVMTDWKEFATLSLARMRRTMRGDGLLDARNLFNAAIARRLGFRYIGVGIPLA